MIVLRPKQCYNKRKIIMILIGLKESHTTKRRTTIKLIMKGCNKSMKTLMVILKTKRKNEENEEQSHDHSESVHNKK